MSQAEKPKLERVAVRRHALFFLVLLGLSIGIVEPAAAAGPQVRATWAASVGPTEASLRTRFDCGGLSTGYRFEYLTARKLQANVDAGGDGFAGASSVPQPEAQAGECTENAIHTQVLKGLQQQTAYVYRVVARNSDGMTAGPEEELTTLGGAAPFALLDDRGWEMVSPVEKNGGTIEGFGGDDGGGVLQAAAQGAAVTFSSGTSFSAGAEGAPGGSQYFSRRSEAGWSTTNISAPLSAGAYGTEPEGVPYQLFSPDLSRGLLAGTPDLPLAGSGAPAGYADYYLREAGGSYTALLRQADIADLLLAPRDFLLSFAGASADLTHVVLSTCAALTAEAVEVPAGEGCDPGSPNLYEWSPAGLRLLNLLPGHSTGTVPARLAAPAGAVSADGSRVYWTDGSDLYLREGARTVTVATGGEFQLATPDGAVAFFTEAGHLYRYDAAAESAVDLTPAGGIIGVLGASADGTYVYVATATGISLAHGGSVEAVAGAPDSVNFPPAVGTARVSADGTRLLFLSSARITRYESANPLTGQRYDEAYLYDADSRAVTCVSCNPSGEFPTGSATVPGAVANGVGPGATRAYRPRALTDGGRRVFFDSPDPLAGNQDTNKEPDVYEWEAGGTGSCAHPQGCLQLISNGRSEGGATFVDASEDGRDVFFLTDGSLVQSDPGAVDLYDAREGGGFPEAPNPIPCEEDACQPVPPPPDDPSPGSLAPSTGNPPPHHSKPKHGKRGKSHRAKHKRHRPRHARSGARR